MVPTPHHPVVAGLGQHARCLQVVGVDVGDRWPGRARRNDRHRQIAEIHGFLNGLAACIVLSQQVAQLVIHVVRRVHRRSLDDALAPTVVAIARGNAFCRRTVHAAIGIVCIEDRAIAQQITCRVICVGFSGHRAGGGVQAVAGGADGIGVGRLDRRLTVCKLNLASRFPNYSHARFAPKFRDSQLARLHAKHP